MIFFCSFFDRKRDKKNLFFLKSVEKKRVMKKISHEIFVCLFVCLFVGVDLIHAQREGVLMEKVSVKCE